MRRIMCAAFIVLTETAATANAEKWGDDEYFIDRASPEDAAATKPTFHKSPNTKYKKEKKLSTRRRCQEVRPSVYKIAHIRSLSANITHETLVRARV